MISQVAETQPPEPQGPHLVAHPTASIAETAIIRGSGVVEVGAYAVVEDFVVIDLGGSGRGKLELAARSKLKIGVVIRNYNGSVRVGEHTTLGDYTVIHGHGGVDIGRDGGIAPHCSIAASEHIWTSSEVPIRYQGETARGIRIGDDVWLGTGVRVLDGVAVGNGVVIGAGAVVNSDLPAMHICAGIPCRVIRPRPISVEEEKQ
ncbi:hypothetical protein GCM10009812_13290 [Nocardioides marinus]|uniref:Acetyltransferase-like isoleucine patch superfamily enzyme n=1 Tax=Nocardioides marinus TaxID=374514 RepID=A0A7Y9YCZ1_9ACTN|nr:acetyltransferase-like isoleucine patch superfamily enzyme [Nocardioides marinus]